MSKNKILYPTPTDFFAPSFFKNVSDKEPQPLSWEAIYTKITQDLDIAEKTMSSRALLAQGNKVGQPQAIRKTLCLAHTSGIPPRHLAVNSDAKPRHPRRRRRASNPKKRQ